MYILKPIPHETIWGGTKLLAYGNGNEQQIGHLYSLFDDESGSNEILNGIYAGKPFHDLFRKNRAEWGMGQYERFPLVLALVEARENLSIQVHPDDIVASNLENAPWGKNESWYFMEAPKEGTIVCGSKIKDKNVISRRIMEGRGGEIADCLEVRQGDYVYVQAGTLHAMTSGSFVYEIEENSEYTYRLYDYDRCDSMGKTRELHIEKGMHALKPELKSVTRRYEDFPKSMITERMYETRLLSASETNHYRNKSCTIECLTVIDFDTDIRLEECPVRIGTCIVLEPGEELEEGLGTTMMARCI